MQKLALDSSVKCRTGTLARRAHDGQECPSYRGHAAIDRVGGSRNIREGTLVVSNSPAYSASDTLGLLTLFSLM